MRSLLLLLLLFSLFVNAQNTNQSDLVSSYTKQAVIIEPSGNNPHYAIDDQIKTYWQSENPLPEKYISSKAMNVLHNNASNSVISINSNAFDGDLNTAILVKKEFGSTAASYVVKLNKPIILTYFSVKAASENNLKILLTYVDKTTQNIDLSAEDSYRLKAFMPEKTIAIKSISFSSASSFQLFELAGMSDFPEVYFTLDLGIQKRIGQCYSRHFNSENIRAIELQYSNNGSDWAMISELDPAAIQLLPTVLENPVNARFVRVKFVLGWQDYGKASLWELKLFDEFGPYGLPAEFVVSKQAFNQRLGLNMVWGWGRHVYSDQINDGKGWQQYQNYFKKLRIYHNLHWDITAPGSPANYQQMIQGQGTAANWWLNWVREYGFLKQQGFELSSALLFKNETIPVKQWPNPAENAYNIGVEFGQFISKKNLAEAVEVGNEPWDYPPDFYRLVSENMARGLKDNSTGLKILPAAFQNSFVKGAFNEMSNYLPAFVSQDMLTNVDALNAHFYAHTFNEQGVRISVPPEDPRAEIHGIRNIIRYKNENAADKAVWVTEFGYDGDHLTECCMHSECVSEAQQAAWGLRGVFYLLRQGAERVYWYFYANEATETFLHSRAGLTLSDNHNFEPKASYFAFRDALKLLGDFYFSDVIIESDKLIAYQFTNDRLNKKYLIAWMPNNQEPENGKSLPKFFKETINRVFVLDGKPDNNWSEPESQNEIFLSGYPRVFDISE